MMMVIICYHQHLMVIAIRKNQTKYPGQPCWDGSPKKNLDQCDQCLIIALSENMVSQKY